MEKSYSLNQFYAEAKKLIKKHKIDFPEHVLEADFQMGERSGEIKLNCCIRYRKDYEYTLFSAASTPEAALLAFEADIIQFGNGLTTKEVAVVYQEDAQPVES